MHERRNGRSLVYQGSYGRGDVMVSCQESGNMRKILGVLALSPPWLGKQQHAWAVHHSLPRIKGLLPWTIHPQPLQLILLLPLLHLVST